MAARVTAGRADTTAAVQWNIMETIARKVRRIYRVSGRAARPVYTTLDKKALFLQLDLPPLLIRPENGAFSNDGMGLPYMPDFSLNKSPKRALIVMFSNFSGLAWTGIIVFSECKQFFVTVT